MHEMKIPTLQSLPDPDMRTWWEIDAISDPVEFMRFIFTHADPDQRWVCQGFAHDKTRELLSPLADLVLRPKRFWFIQYGPDDMQFHLTEQNRSKLSSALPQIDWTLEPFHHHVTDGSEWLLVSYDNLSCCWVSDSISKTTMKEAATRCHFHFLDPKDL